MGKANRKKKAARKNAREKEKQEHRQQNTDSSGKYNNNKFYRLKFVGGDTSLTVPAQGDHISSIFLFGSSIGERTIEDMVIGDKSLVEFPLPDIEQVKSILIANNEMYRELTHRVYFLNKLGNLIPKQRVLFFRGLGDEGFLESAIEQGLFQYDNLNDVIERNTLVKGKNGETAIDFSKKEMDYAGYTIYQILKPWVEQRNKKTVINRLWKKRKQLHLVKPRTVRTWLLGDKYGNLTTRFLEYYELFAEKIHSGFKEYLPGRKGSYYDDYRQLNGINKSLGHRINKPDIIMQILKKLSESGVSEDSESDLEIEITRTIKTTEDGSQDGVDESEETKAKTKISIDMIPFYTTLAKFLDEDEKVYNLPMVLAEKTEITETEFKEDLEKYEKRKKDNPKTPYLFLTTKRKTKSLLTGKLNYLNPVERFNHLNILNDLFLSVLMKYLHPVFQDEHIPTRLIDHIKAGVFSNELNNPYWDAVVERDDKTGGMLHKHGYTKIVKKFTELVSADLEAGNFDRQLNLPDGTVKTLLETYKTIDRSMPSYLWKTKAEFARTKEDWIEVASKKHKEHAAMMDDVVPIEDMMAEIEADVQKADEMRKDLEYERRTNNSGAKTYKMGQELLEDLKKKKKAGQTEYQKTDPREVLVGMGQELELIKSFIKSRNETLRTKILGKTGIDISGIGKNPRLLLHYLCATPSESFYVSMDMFSLLQDNGDATNYAARVAHQKRTFMDKEYVKEVLAEYKLKPLFDILHNNNFVHETRKFEKEYDVQQANIENAKEIIAEIDPDGAPLDPGPLDNPMYDHVKQKMMEKLELSRPNEEEMFPRLLNLVNELSTTPLFKNNLRNKR